MSDQTRRGEPSQDFRRKKLEDDIEVDKVERGLNNFRPRSKLSEESKRDGGDGDGCMQSCPPSLDLGRGDEDEKKIKKEETFWNFRPRGPLSLIKGGLDSMPGPDWGANK